MKQRTKKKRAARERAIARKYERIQRDSHLRITRTALLAAYQERFGHVPPMPWS